MASENAVERCSSCGGRDSTVQRRWAQAGRKLYSGPILSSSLRRGRCRYYCISLAEGHFGSPGIDTPAWSLPSQCLPLLFITCFGLRVIFFFPCMSTKLPLHNIQGLVGLVLGYIDT